MVPRDRMKHLDFSRLGATLCALCLLPALAAAEDTDEAGQAAGPGEVNFSTDSVELPSPALSPAEEKKLLTELKIFGSTWQDRAELWSSNTIQDQIGRSRSRRLSEARFYFHLYSDPNVIDREAYENRVDMEGIEGTVRSAYSKLLRESAERALDLEGRWQRWRDGRSRRASDESSSRGGIDISPRVGLGDNEYFGLKMRPDDREHPVLRHLSFEVRHYFDEDQTVFGMKYDHKDHFFYMAFEPDHQESGDRVSLSLRLWF